MTRSRTTGGGVVALVLVAAACTGTAGGTAAPTGAPGAAPTPVASPAPSPTPTSGPTPTPDPAAFVLGEYGPYHVGTQQISTVDAGRRGRRIGVTVWYPAVTLAGFQGPGPSANAEPDPGGGPYPLILSSTTMARRLAPIVVSHGFAWASVDNIDTYRSINPEMVEQPRDILAALDLVATSPPANLRGMIDTDHAGAIGYSFDGYNAYVLGGARIDPTYYRAQCPTPDAITDPLVRSGYTAFACLAPRQWDTFVARADEVAVAGSDGLWQPMTDERIRAVMPMAGEGWWLFGDRGLAAFDRPALVIAATGDELYAENELMFRHLGTDDRSFIAMVGPGHLIVMDEAAKAVFGHFATAFFGHRLAGREDCARYYSKEFVDLHPELRWGIPDAE